MMSHVLDHLIFLIAYIITHDSEKRVQ